MTEFTEAYDFQGRTLIDRDGDKIGTVDEVYTDHEGGQPEWALVHTGLFGTSRHFVPLRGASTSGEDIMVTVDKQAVKDAPSVPADQELSQAEERTLFEHYGVPYTTEGSTTATQGARDDDDATTRRPGGDDDDATTRRPGGDDDAMTRSEEEVDVGTRTREAGRARLRKYVVTEHVQQTVPVQREEVRLEREPVTDANVGEATAGPEISEAEHEVVLHQEEPVVEKRTVPKERVRLDTDTITEDREVSEEVRKERIDIDDARS